MKEYIIGRNDAGQRFDKYLMKLLCNAKQSLIFKQLRNKNIVLNNAKAKGSEILKESDSVKIFMADDTLLLFTQKEQQVVKSSFSMKVIYEDEDVILVDKPVGVLSQKAEVDDLSMNEYLLEYLSDRGLTKDSTFKPAFCNRLDRNTSGLMIGGTSFRGLQQMSAILKDRTIGKYYLAIVVGQVKRGKSIQGYMKKDEKKNQVKIYDSPGEDMDEIATEYAPIAYREGLTLLRVHLITGKTHQIRAHLAYVGHPVLGDPKYGDAKANQTFQAKRQLLHSYEVQFPVFEEGFQGISGRTFCTAYPKDFAKYFREKQGF